MKSILANRAGYYINYDGKCLANMAGYNMPLQTTQCPSIKYLDLCKTLECTEPKVLLFLEVIVR